MSLLAAISTTLVARGLSTQGFGSQSFAVSFLVFTALLFDFGLFLPAARLTASSPPSSRASWVGASLIAFLPMGMAFSALVFVLGFFVDSWFHVHAGLALRLIAPLAFIYPIQLLGMYLAQAVERVHVLSITGVATQALYVAPLAALTAAHAKLSVVLVVVLRIAALALCTGALIAWLSPVFAGARARIPELVRGAREYGIQVYFGRVLSIATYNMDVLMLGALTDAKTVGFYAVAGSTAYLVGLPASGLAAALFSRMTKAVTIERRWLSATWITGLGGALAVSALAHPMIPLVFSARYRPAIALVPPLAFAEAVRGVTGIYNSFLQAQGRGRELRNAALVLTLSNVALNFALIPPFGALGAAWASLGALMANFVAHVLSYRRALRMAAATSS